MTRNKKIGVLYSDLIFDVLLFLLELLLKSDF